MNKTFYLLATLTLASSCSGDLQENDHEFFNNLDTAISQTSEDTVTPVNDKNQMIASSYDFKIPYVDDIYNMASDEIYFDKTNEADDNLYFEYCKDAVKKAESVYSLALNKCNPFALASRVDVLEVDSVVEKMSEMRSELDLALTKLSPRVTNCKVKENYSFEEINILKFLENIEEKLADIQSESYCPARSREALLEARYHGVYGVNYQLDKRVYRKIETDIKPVISTKSVNIIGFDKTTHGSNSVPEACLKILRDVEKISEAHDSCVSVAGNGHRVVEKLADMTFIHSSKTAQIEFEVNKYRCSVITVQGDREFSSILDYLESYYLDAHTSCSDMM